jgi:hypothetical protein
LKLFFIQTNSFLSKTDRDNEQTLVQTMSRTDQTHTTFLACLRDWNDPYLHGQKPTKTIGCNRCENCGCRLLLNNDLVGSLSSKDLASATTASSTPMFDCKTSPFEMHCHQAAATNTDYQSNTNSKLNKNQIETVHRHRKHSHNKSGFEIQPLTRSKSSINVPKTIDKCIKMSKSRPRPSSIRPHASPLSGLLINEAALPTFKRQLSLKLKPTQTCMNSSSNEKIKNENSSISYSTDEKEMMLVNKKYLIDIERDSLEFVRTNENETQFRSVPHSPQSTHEPIDNIEFQKPTESTMSCSSLSASSNANLASSNEIQMSLRTPDPDIKINQEDISNHSNDNNNHDNDDNHNNTNAKRLDENQKLFDSASLFSSSTSLNNNANENNANNLDDSLQDKSFDSDR